MGEVVRVCVIGDFHVALADGRPATFRTRRAAEIIAHLCLRETRRMLRADLAAAIWPDADRSTRLRNLRPALNYARTGLESADAIDATEDWLQLSHGVECDWREAALLETQIQQASTDEERLVLLYSLNNLIQKPLLANWDCEWLETLRLYHDQRRLNSLRQLSEELGARGEWRAALDYARQMSELDAASEDAVRLQLRYLGELDRPAEARRAFELYAKNLRSVLDLPVNPSLRQFAEEVATGRFRKTGSRPLTAVQQEMIADIMGVLADEEPERLLPLLASPKLNWSLVLHGPELKPILERAMVATSGWSPERCGVAKRLLQVYSQEQNWAKLTALASELASSSEPSDRIASLNFLAFERKSVLDYPGALEMYDQAVEIAAAEKDVYLEAISVANRAILNVCFGLYQLGKEELRTVLAILEERREPNARFAVSLARAWMVEVSLMRGDLDAVDSAAQGWRQYAEQNGTLAFDAQGKLLYGCVLARRGERGAREWLVSGIDTTFQTRYKVAHLEQAFLAIFGLKGLGLVSEAGAASQGIRRIAQAMGYRIMPVHDDMLVRSTTSSKAERWPTAAELLGFCREQLLSAT